MKETRGKSVKSLPIKFGENPDAAPQNEQVNYGAHMKNQHTYTEAEDTTGTASQGS